MKTMPLLLFMFSTIFTLHAGEKQVSKQSNSRDWTAWHYAAAGLYYKALDLLLTTSIPPITSVDKEGWMPIHVAANAGNIRMCKFLLEHGASIEAIHDTKEENTKGWRPLHVATYEGRQPTCAYLLIHKANVDAQTATGHTALHIAADKGLKDICLLLLDHKANRDLITHDGQTALELARRCNHEVIINILTSNSTTAKTPFQQLITEKLMQKQRESKQQKEQCDTTGWNAWHFAAAEQFSVAFEKLLNEGTGTISDMLMSRDAHGWTPLHVAAANNKRLMCAFFLKHAAVAINIPNDNADEEIRGWTPLHMAANYGHLDTCKFLVMHNATVNAKTATGYTALHIASERGWWDIVQLLLQHGADENLKTNAGLTALQLAEKHKQEETVKILTPPASPVGSAANTPTRAMLLAESSSTAGSAAAADSLV